MAAGQLHHIVHRLRLAGLRQDVAALTDAQLLECFLTQHDEAAFELLVRRHRPMVYGVCRRLLGNHHDAEDAFQATFLVLAHKAATIAPRSQVGNWLYGVAYHTALKARADGQRRRAKEREAAAMPKPSPADNVWSQLEPLLDGALQGLPDKYRTIIVLCELEGRTRKEAARQLGCPEGTIASRLARDRQLLARRLARHSLTLSAAALAEVVSQGAASAGASSKAVAGVVKAGTLFAAGQAWPAGLISPQVLALKEGVLQAMFMTKLKIAGAVLAVLMLVCLGATWFPSSAPAQNYQPTPKPEHPRKAKETDNPLKGDSVQPNPRPGQPTPKPEHPQPGATLTLQDVRLDDVNIAGKTVSVSVATGTSSTSGSTGPGGGGSGSSSSAVSMEKLVGLPVARDAQITVEKKAATLAALKPGMHVTLKLAVKNNALVVVGIQMEAGVDSDEAARARDTCELAQEKLKQSEAKLALALVNVEVAEKNLNDATLVGNAVAIEEAKALLQAALAEKAVAQAQVELEGARALQAMEIYNAIKAKTKPK